LCPKEGREREFQGPSLIRHRLGQGSQTDRFIILFGERTFPHKKNGGREKKNG